MSITLFGVTPETVHAHHFPQSAVFTASNKPKRATVLEMIDAAAAELGGKLRAKGLTPSALTLADFPEAYAWCAETVRLSSAIRVYPSMTGTDPEVVRAWQKKLDARYEDLDENGHRALGDAEAPADSGVGAVTHISSLNLDVDAAEEDASELEHRFRVSDRM